MTNKKYHSIPLIACLLIFFFQSCSVSKQINKQAQQILLEDSVISTGHIGISIYEPATNSYWYNYNGDKYFVPASNVKLFTLYAGMKYLGDSLVGARYYHYGNALLINPSGDPTFLHPDYEYQPLFDLLNNSGPMVLINAVNNKINRYGKGWPIDDYEKSYMTERTKFPIYGNNLWISTKPIFPKKLSRDTIIDTVKFFSNYALWIKPKYFCNEIKSSATSINKSKIGRDIVLNRFYIEDDYSTLDSFVYKTIPFSTFSGSASIEILKDIFKNKDIKSGIGVDLKVKDSILYSQPSDSLFAPMMHKSDNFFAEQTLLMVSNEHLGYMNDETIIDTLLKTDLKDIPQKPRWVDGSGLSRYNLFTPQSFVYILSKMKNEFGLERLKTILPTGGEGTLKNYYNSDSGFIYAKTGSLSNQVALSGFVITKRNKLLTFSIIANNVMGDGWKVRRAIEAFMKGLRKRY